MDEAKTLLKDSKTRIGKLKKSACMPTSSDPLSRPSVGTNPIWVPAVLREAMKKIIQNGEEIGRKIERKGVLGEAFQENNLKLTK